MSDMPSAVELAMARADKYEPILSPPKTFTYDPPFSRDTLNRWQAELDQAVPSTEKISRLVLRWESGDPWQVVGRLLIWQCLDPKHVEIEPWIRTALAGPDPRSKGHYCGRGYCLCPTWRNRWVGGATKLIDSATWRLYRETGLYGQRWWTIQGTSGGHRFQVGSDELAAHIAQLKGKPIQTPAPGDLPYAPFDQRVIQAIQAERRMGALEATLKNMGKRKDALSAEEEAEAEAKAKALWDWTDERVEKLWSEGADLLPRYFEEQYGRAPTGTRHTTDFEAVERRFKES